MKKFFAIIFIMVFALSPIVSFATGCGDSARKDGGTDKGSVKDIDVKDDGIGGEGSAESGGENNGIELPYIRLP